MDLGALAGAVAWPMTALVIFFVLRKQATALVEALRLKLGQADQVVIGRDGLTLISTIARQTVLGGSAPDKSLNSPVATALGMPATLAEDERSEFDRLVEEYGACSIPDLAERIRARRRLADRLGELALSLSLDRTELATSAVEGRMVALATAVILDPRIGDLGSLNKAVTQAAFNFTRYRIVLAISPALTIDDNTDATRTALAILTAAEARPNTDANLRSLVQATRRVINPRKPSA